MSNSQILLSYIGRGSKCAVNDDFLKTTVEAIQRGSKDKDGYVGSGKIFVLPLENVIRIRTSENGSDAI